MREQLNELFDKVSSKTPPTENDDYPIFMCAAVAKVLGFEESAVKFWNKDFREKAMSHLMQQYLEAL